MLSMKSALILLMLLGSMVAPSAALAQSEAADAPPEPAPLNVRPAGIAQQDWEPGVAAVRAIQSPIGPALPGLPMVHIADGVGVQATLQLDGRFQRYTYDCDAGRCTGFATDLWLAADGTQRVNYLRAVGDALMQTYPDQSMYVVVVDGRTNGGRPVGANWTWKPTSGESYFFVPAL